LFFVSEVPLKNSMPDAISYTGLLTDRSLLGRFPLEHLRTFSDALSTP
jgi:hypothetical protein